MVRLRTASEKLMWQVGLRKCIRPLLERFLRAMMECAALCSSLNRQSCEDCFTPQVSRAPGSTVEPSHFSPADLVENQIPRSSSRWAVDVEIAHAISKPGIGQASSAGQSGCLQTGQSRRVELFFLCEHGPSYSGQFVSQGHGNDVVVGTACELCQPLV